MPNILEYYNQLSKDITKGEDLSKTFISFYLYFRKLHEKNLISNSALSSLDSALEFSEPLTDNPESTKSYLITKQSQLEKFLKELRLNYDKIIKNLKKTFNIPSNYSYEEVCSLITQSYITYAAFRYKKNLENTILLEETFKGENKFYEVPKYIPEHNANISECLELASGIKLLSLDGASYELFNIFNEKLNVRTIVDTADGQIIALFINGEEHTEVPSSLIKRLKQQIKKGKVISKK